MIPKRRTKPKKPNPDRVNRSHQQWVRGFGCVVSGCKSANVEFAHVRCGIDNPAERGGVGLKPADAWGIPLCGMHHKIQHTLGEVSFDQTYGVDRIKTAKELAAKSPHLKKMGDK